ncbi:hypothetical protein HHI36_001536 [Cryptolaemus montrouzieri]|uniref:Uncharacterized protein n=1 Tax=Cryptolaemus montrouzieri TaxID=559131 RepID=A0ABD2P878_9CUCU
MRDQFHLVPDLLNKYTINDLLLGHSKLRYWYRLELRKANVAYNDRLIRESSNKGKTLWGIVNKARSDNTVSCHNAISPQDFNNFFVSILLMISNNITQFNMDLESTFRSEVPANFSFQLTLISYHDVRDVILADVSNPDLKNSRSADYYGLLV